MANNRPTTSHLWLMSPPKQCTSTRSTWRFHRSFSRQDSSRVAAPAAKLQVRCRPSWTCQKNMPMGPIHTDFNLRDWMSSVLFDVHIQKMYRISASQKLCFFVPILTYGCIWTYRGKYLFQRSDIYTVIVSLHTTEWGTSKSFCTSTSILKRSSLRITSCEGKDVAAAWTPWCWPWPRECQETRTGYIGSSPWRRLNGRRLGAKWCYVAMFMKMLSCYGPVMSWKCRRLSIHFNFRDLHETFDLLSIFE